MTPSLMDLPISTMQQGTCSRVSRGCAPQLSSIKRKVGVMDFWDFFWLLVWTFFFVCYLMVLFQVIGDLFRDKELSGWWKALWIIFLIIFPFLALIIYLIARGRGMAERQAGEVRKAQVATDQYIQTVASRSNPTEQIASAKNLLDSGAITQEEFEKLKQKALAS